MNGEAFSKSVWHLWPVEALAFSSLPSRVCESSVGTRIIGFPRVVMIRLVSPPVVR